MNNELAVVLSNDNKNVTVLETLESIEKAGFKKVFLQWYDNDLEISQEEQAKLCKEKNLDIIFAHLGYQKINDIWTEDGDYHVDRFKKDIFDCHSAGINMVVMHPCSKWEAPAPNELGLKRFKEIVEYAKSLGVKVALENTKIHGYIEYLLDNIKDDNLGVCFDCGHYHCNFKDDWDISRFKDKIFCVHLHDNDGKDDLHLLPFDGNLDWNKIIEMLKEVNYDGPVTMELCYNRDYLNMSLDDFYNEGYQRGLKLTHIV